MVFDLLPKSLKLKGGLSGVWSFPALESHTIPPTNLTQPTHSTTKAWSQKRYSHPKGEGLTRTTAVEESLAGIQYTAGPPSEAALVLVMLGEAWETRGA